MSILRHDQAQAIFFMTCRSAPPRAQARTATYSNLSIFSDAQPPKPMENRKSRLPVVRFVRTKRDTACIGRGHCAPIALSQSNTHTPTRKVGNATPSAHTILSTFPANCESSNTCRQTVRANLSTFPTINDASRTAASVAHTNLSIFPKVDRWPQATPSSHTFCFLLLVFWLSPKETKLAHLLPLQNANHLPHSPLQREKIFARAQHSSFLSWLRETSTTGYKLVRQGCQEPTANEPT